MGYRMQQGCKAALHQEWPPPLLADAARDLVEIFLVDLMLLQRQEWAFALRLFQPSKPVLLPEGPN
jgi:hypothetical protein